MDRSRMAVGQDYAVVYTRHGKKPPTVKRATLVKTGVKFSEGGSRFKGIVVQFDDEPTTKLVSSYAILDEWNEYVRKQRVLEMKDAPEPATEPSSPDSNTRPVVTLMSSYYNFDKQAPGVWITTSDGRIMRYEEGTWWTLPEIPEPAL